MESRFTYETSLWLCLSGVILIWLALGCTCEAPCMVVTGVKWWWGDGENHRRQCCTLKFVLTEKWGQKMLVFYSVSGWRDVEVLICRLLSQGDCWSNAALAWRGGPWDSALPFVGCANWGLIKAKGTVWILAPCALVKCCTVTQQLLLLQNSFPCSPCSLLWEVCWELLQLLHSRQWWIGPFCNLAPFSDSLMKFIHFFLDRILLLSTPPPHFNIKWVISHLLGPLTYVVSFYLNCSYAHWFLFQLLL